MWKPQSSCSTDSNIISPSLLQVLSWAMPWYRTGSWSRTLAPCPTRLPTCLPGAFMSSGWRLAPLKAAPLVPRHQAAPRRHHPRVPLTWLCLPWMPAVCEHCGHPRPSPMADWSMRLSSLDSSMLHQVSCFLWGLIWLFWRITECGMFVYVVLEAGWYS